MQRAQGVSSSKACMLIYCKGGFRPAQQILTSARWVAALLSLAAFLESSLRCPFWRLAALSSSFTRPAEASAAFWASCLSDLTHSTSFSSCSQRPCKQHSICYGNLKPITA